MRPASPPSPARAIAIACLAAAALLLAAAPAHAAHQTAARKFGRGLAAMTCGFLEIPGNVVQTTRERGPAWGATLGFVQGLGRVVVRELVGVYEFVTAPFPVPPGYQPIIQPEFPWDYFD
jgi:putative exosortase-associated protein (TIGR04073 family)